MGGVRKGVRVDAPNSPFDLKRVRDKRATELLNFEGHQNRMHGDDRAPGGEGGRMQRRGGYAEEGEMQRRGRYAEEGEDGGLCMSALECIFSFVTVHISICVFLPLLSYIFPFVFFFPLLPYTLPSAPFFPLSPYIFPLPYIFPFVFFFPLLSLLIWDSVGTAAAAMVIRTTCSGINITRQHTHAHTRTELWGRRAARFVGE